MILREKKMKEEIDKMEVKMVMWPKWGGDSNEYGM